MKTLRNDAFILATVCLFAAAALVSVANATPYASGISNNAGTLSFILNESADSVKVLVNGGSSTNSLGALAKGVHSLSLGAATNYQIVVSKNSPPGYRSQTGGTTNFYLNANQPTASILQISDDTTPRLTFSSPRGIAINRRVNSPYFGRVYVANSASGTVTSLGGVTRTVGDGVYVLNPDLSDALGQGDTPRAAGLSSTFALSTESPYRLTLGPDDMLYICDKGTTVTENLYMTDANVTDGSGTNLLKVFSGATQFPVTSANNHGRIECAAIIGSLASNNWRAMFQDEDLQNDPSSSSSTTRNSIWRTSNGANLGWANIPYTGVTAPTWNPTSGSRQGQGGYICDFEMVGSITLLYIVVDRDDGNFLFVANNTSTLFTSANAALSGYCVGVTADTNYVAVGQRLDGFVWVYPTDSNHYPKESRVMVLPVGIGSIDGIYYNTNAIYEVRFDAAANMYIVQNGYYLMRVFSPGGASVATTGNDSTGTNGTFSVQFGPAINPQPTNTTVNPGDAARFSVTADGAAPLSYQWLKNGTPLVDDGVHVTGATSASLTVNNAQCADCGSYQVIVTNVVGAATSVVATLTATGCPPWITGHEVLGDGSFKLTFTGPNGQGYSVWWSTDVAAPVSGWNYLTGGIFGAGPETCTDTGAISEPARYYIVRSP